LQKPTVRFIFVLSYILIEMSKGEKTKQHIVDKAARIFNQKGYAGTSMYDIVEATGLSKGGVYGNFRNKEAIALAAFDHAVNTVWREVRNHTSQVENHIDKLITAVKFYKQHVLNPPIDGGCPVQNMAIEADDNNPILRDRVRLVVDEWQRQVIKTLEKGKKVGEVIAEVDSKVFAVQFIGILEGGILLAQLYKDDHYFEMVNRQLISMLESIRKK
jgi:TetR/AcrR family transcriptional repressor of nem operon